MHYLPGAILGSKGHRDPQIAGGDILRAADLRIGPLYPQDAGKLISHVLCYGLEVVDLAFSEYGCPTLLGLSDLLPSPRGRAEGIGEGYVFSVGEELLHRLWISFDELLARLLELFEYSVEIIYRSQLEITSIVATLRASYAIHPSFWKFGILKESISRNLHRIAHCKREHATRRPIAPEDNPKDVGWGIDMRSSG
jgi:hypothetical protein